MSPTSYQAAPPRVNVLIHHVNRLSPGRRLSRPSFKLGGDDRDRTGDLLLAKQALSQLSYAP